MRRSLRQRQRAAKAPVLGHRLLRDVQIMPSAQAKAVKRRLKYMNATARRREAAP